MFNYWVLSLKVCWTRVVPFLSYFIDERWDLKLTQAWSDGFSGLRAIWVMQDVLMPISAKLLSALLVPYVLAKGVFPTFGYSIAVNSTVHRFAWLGSLGVCVLYHLGKLACKFFVKLHDSIRDERYLVGQKLQNYTDNGEASLLRG
jgi:E3 ubiquitin-protein ligase MARCH6